MATDTIPADVMTLRQAAELVGRSVDTLRRWRWEHGLRDWRNTADMSSPSLVSRSDVLALVARLQAGRPGVDGIVDGVVVGSADADRIGTHLRPAPAGGSALIAGLVDDLRAARDMAQAALQAERDRAQLERDRAQAAVDALDAARRDTLELVARLTRLETLVLSGKVRALEAERAALADRAGVKLKRPKPKR
jgi:hypothetical protein